MPEAAALTPAAQAAQEFAQSLVPGRKVGSAMQRVVTDLTWHRRLDDAAKAARAQGKPIVWVQALGELRGLT